MNETLSSSGKKIMMEMLPKYKLELATAKSQDQRIYVTEKFIQEFASFVGMRMNCFDTLADLD